MTGKRTVSRKLAAVVAAALSALSLAAAAAPASAAFGLTGFDGRVLEENGNPATQAGSHPFTASTEFSLTAAFDQAGYEYPSEDLKDAIVGIPPGLVGNPQIVAQCTEDQLASGFSGNCSPESQVGIVTLYVGSATFYGAPGEPPTPFPIPIFNMEPPFGTPAVFGFSVLGVPIHVYPNLRTGEDYGLTVTTKNAAETIPIVGVNFTLWSVPADPAHDGERVGPTTAPLKPFLSLPTSCTGPGPNNSVETTITVTSWPGGTDSASFFSHDNSLPTPNPIGTDGCNAVDFSPSLEARPTTTVADAPSGLDVNLQIPQHEDCDPGPPVVCENAEAHLKDTVVTLPEGLVVNPSGANGLDGCSPAEFGLTTPVGTTPYHTTAGPATCPDASKLGTVQIDTQLLDHPLLGGVYIADPYQNPFSSLIAIYISVDDPQTGLVVKLAGEVYADPVTGQLSATFDDNPQLPFEAFKLKFFGGAGGSLRTPAVCGNHTTTSSLTPWSAPDSGPPAAPEDTWAITQGSNGGACASSAAEQPHGPSFDAGTVSPIGGAYSPMVVNLRREDGSQNFSEVTVSPPPGLTGKLAGIPACPDLALAAAASKSGQEEKANPSCPAASRVGTVDVAAGAGPAPYWAQGTAYLAGPYKGAPISLAIITPAVAGPFDVGTVVVRTALYVDSATAQITAKADPLPSILQGIPLDIRQALIQLDRPEFSLNPTNCDPMAFTGQLVSTLGQPASLSKRFQLGECSGLGLKPKMSLSLKGGTRRRAHPALTATLEPRAGDANLASVSVALPPTELLDNAHIGTVCTRVQFAASECPADSIYGTATVTTPLLDYPLTGNVYLRSSSNPLPDLVPDFRGPASQPIKLESAGRTDTVKGGLRNTFDAVPDAPFTKLTLSLFGGKKGLIQNSTDVCAKKYRATVKYTAHNGLSLEQNPPLKAKCPKKKRKPRVKRHHRHPVR